MSDRFEAYYDNIYGFRWPQLRESLAAEPFRSAVESGLRQPYWMDGASVAVARLLPLGGADTILDACAAPGGKALVIAAAMRASAALTANERSSARRARLHRVLDEHLPPDVRERVRVTGHDARRWGLHERDAYDAVLADVPCSSERHLLHSAYGAGAWNPRRSKRLAKDQFAILAAMIDACRPGGHVLYVTCTINPIENDAVVAQAPTRRDVEIVTTDRVSFGIAGVEETRYGIAVLPDRCDGKGPLYAALLQKRGPTR